MGHAPPKKIFPSKGWTFLGASAPIPRPALVLPPAAMSSFCSVLGRTMAGRPGAATDAPRASGGRSVGLVGESPVRGSRAGRGSSLHLFGGGHWGLQALLLSPVLSCLPLGAPLFLTLVPTVWAHPGRSRVRSRSNHVGCQRGSGLRTPRRSIIWMD